MAALAGFVCFVMLMVVGEMGFLASVFTAAVVFILLGVVLGWILCRPLPSLAEVSATSGSANTVSVGTSAGAAAGAAVSTAAAGAVALAAEAASASVETAKSVAAGAKEAAKDVAHKASDVAHQAADAAKDAAQSVTETAKEAVQAAMETAKDVAHKASDVAHQAADAAKDAAQSVTETAKEAVQAATETAKEAAPAATGAVASAPAALADAATVEGVRPAALSAPRGGQADNLKEIKGIGPKMEKLCNSLGFYHFDQIASWSADEIAWVDANLEGFRGRVTRDEWVKQAKILAAGGETEFSKRVEDGGVY